MLRSPFGQLFPEDGGHLQAESEAGFRMGEWPPLA